MARPSKPIDGAIADVSEIQPHPNGYSPNGTKFDALVIGYYEGKNLLCCGRVRNGFKALSRAKIMPLLRANPVAACPFANLPMGGHRRWGEGINAADMTELRWVKPQIVVQVGFVEWTRAGLLRHPTFRGIQEDKRAGEVGRGYRPRSGT